MSIAELTFVLAIAAATAFLALFSHRRFGKSDAGALSPHGEPVALLFEDGILHHATNRALTNFAFFPGASVWGDLYEALSPRFSGFPTRLEGCASGAMTVLCDDPDDDTVVEISWRDSLCWVDLKEMDHHHAVLGLSVSDILAQQLCCDHHHGPMWEVLDNGRVGWRNPAYDRLCEDQSVAPATLLFETPRDSATHRVALPPVQGAARWFELRRIRSGDRTLCQARDISDLVAAEQVQRAFTQTLTKTFAHLSVGLAIFDRRGRLSIFNPALVDLTGLRPSYLATQPAMISFFDQLRENRCLPEPKNYRSWRQEITAVIAAASDGTYKETWSLEDGRTYFVQGRAHPDGATAFMIEDISSEITLTRNFHAERAQYELLLDGIEDAIAVFTSNGVLTFCNESYRRFFAHNPEAAFADVTLADAIDVWDKTLSARDDDWARIDAAVMGRKSPRKAVATLRAKDGRALACEVTALGVDATKVSFRFLPQAKQTPTARRSKTAV